MLMPSDNLIEQLTKEAVKSYWGIRSNGVLSGQTMDGFAAVLKHILNGIGIRNDEIIMGRNAKLPGYFRLSKDWDMLVVKDMPNGQKKLIAVIEFKSMFGSVGNNLNNRIEEAVGSSFDLLKAYERGTFGVNKPYLGYVFIMGKHPKNIGGNSRSKMLFPALSEFENFPRTNKPANYEQRAEIFMVNMLQEQLYDNCAFIIADDIKKGEYITPNNELSVNLLVKSLVGHVIANK